jgi:hypothetical protein
MTSVSKAKNYSALVAQLSNVRINGNYLTYQRKVVQIHTLSWQGKLTSRQVRKVEQEYKSSAKMWRCLVQNIESGQAIGRLCGGRTPKIPDLSDSGIALDARHYPTGY